MKDYEIIELCARAMGKPAYEPLAIFEGEGTYDPLKNDAQAMALVKKLQLFIMPEHEGLAWHVSDKKDNEKFGVGDDDLNRAICLCVANMQKAK